MAAFTPFTKTDWDGMAGAQPFADGSDPLVCYDVSVDGLDAFAVIDGNGFYMEILTPDGETVASIGDEPIELPNLARFLATWKADYTTGELIDMGLEPVRRG